MSHGDAAFPCIFSAMAKLAPPGAPAQPTACLPEVEHSAAKQFRSATSRRREYACRVLHGHTASTNAGAAASAAAQQDFRGCRHIVRLHGQSATFQLCLSLGDVHFMCSHAPEINASRVIA